MKIIGPATDFWRVRLVRVDTTNDLDFEWHEDILYRQPPVTDVGEVGLWRIEAIRTDDLDVIVCVASLESRQRAEELFELVSEHLRDMTKSQFEEMYLTPAQSPCEEDRDSE
jgi:hypothetical protein